MVESSDKTWSTGEGNGKPLQYSCLESPMNSRKRQKDRTPKDELPRLVGARCATGEQWPMKKKCKKAKWLSEEALQITEKRREAKGKRERERYTYLNIEFQRIARKAKKAFFSEQCKEIEENNRMGKMRDIFKKIRDTKMGTIKNRHFKDLTEAEEIKKQWLEYTELY